jgi:Glycosyl transferases group 1
MKILLLGNFGTAWDGSICDEENIAKALEELGHEVTRWKREYDIPPMVHGPGPGYDFILVAQWDGYNVQHLKRFANYYGKYRGSKEWVDCLLVYWAFDYQPDGQEWHNNLISISDIYLSKRLADSKYPNWHWACDFAPDFLTKSFQPPPKKSIDVLFTGSWLPWATERNATLKKLDEAFSLEIHSANASEWPKEFKNVQGPVMDQGLPKLIARTKVNVAIDHTPEAGYWSDRAAQVIACGGFCLQCYVPLMETYFHNNLAYFYNPDQAVQQTKWWLEHEEDREVFAANAFESSSQYKCQQRVSDVLTIIRSRL